MYIYVYIQIYIYVFIHMIISFKPIASEGRIGLGLSSPKLTKSLLSINHFHIDGNCLFKISSIILTSSLGRKYNYHLHTNRSQLLIVIGKIFLHIIENRVLQEWRLVIHLALMFQPQKKTLRQTKNLCSRDRNQSISGN